MTKGIHKEITDRILKDKVDKMVLKKFLYVQGISREAAQNVSQTIFQQNLKKKDFSKGSRKEIFNKFQKEFARYMPNKHDKWLHVFTQ